MWVRFQVDFASVNICEDIVPIGSLCDQASKRSWVWIPPMGRVKHKYTNKKIFLFYLTGDGDVTSELAPVETNCPFNGHFTFTFSRQMSSLNVNSAEDACNRKSFYLNNCPGSNWKPFFEIFWCNSVLPTTMGAWSVANLVNALQMQFVALPRVAL